MQNYKFGDFFKARKAAGAGAGLNAASGGLNSGAGASAGASLNAGANAGVSGAQLSADKKAQVKALAGQTNVDNQQIYQGAGLSANNQSEVGKAFRKIFGGSDERPASNIKPNTSYSVDSGKAAAFKGVFGRE